MRWVAPLVLLLLTPGAAAWSAELVSAPSGVSLRESLLLAGALEARVDGGAFGAPRARLLTFDAPVTVRMCPDQAGEQQPASGCPGAEETTGARLYLRAGGVVVAPEVNAPVALRSPATAAALGGPNVTLNRVTVGPGVYSGGASVVTANGSTFLVRPLLSLASIEVRGDQGFRTYNGTSYTLYVSGANSSRLEAHGAFLAGENAQVALTRAGVREAEAGIALDALYDLLRALQPPERADRRADLAEAFGPFRVVPPLLDGAVAARTNLTLNGEPRDEFTFLRVQEARLQHDGANWTGSSDASYLVDDDVLAPRPDARVRFPVVIPVVFLTAALVARILTHRSAPPRRKRVLAHALRLAGLVALCLLAAAVLSPLLGFSPLLDAPLLSPRSRAQLALLVVGMLGSAWLAVGFPTESLVRSAFAWREQPRAVLVPVAAGLVAALVFLLLATPILLSFVARFVRL